MQTLTELLQTIVTLVQAAQDAGIRTDVLCLTRADEAVLDAEQLKIHIESLFRAEAEKGRVRRLLNPSDVRCEIYFLKGMQVVWDAERTSVRPFNAEEQTKRRSGSQKAATA
jgi:hypothetical protein